MLVSAIDYNEFVGRIAIGRVERGVLKQNQEIAVCNYHDPDAPAKKAKAVSMYEFQGLGKQPITEATAGNIIAMSGIGDITIGDTICAPDCVEPLPFVKISAPTMEMTFSVNDSPFAGREGKFVTSRQLRDRLFRETLKDVSLRVTELEGATDAFNVAGRGEMSLSILIETMRREGYEFQVSPPRVLYRTIDGKKCEPIERLVADVPSECLEWHGHNDFYKAVTNASTAWLYGACAVNCSLLGIGERTGNIPLEAMVFEYASLRGSLDGMDSTVITEIGEYFEKEIGYKVPPMTPFVGANFNATRAGVHADGLMKDAEIYTIFDTEKLLNRPATVEIGKTSGAAGIAYWINQHFRLKDEAQKVQKHDPLVTQLKEWVDREYEDGRVTMIAHSEILDKIQEFAPGRFPVE